MNLEEQIRHITYTMTDTTTRAIVELKNGFIYKCEVSYVSPYANQYGEKYAKEASLEKLRDFIGYFNAEQRYLATANKVND